MGMVAFHPLGLVLHEVLKLLIFPPQVLALLFGVLQFETRIAFACGLQATIAQDRTDEDGSLLFGNHAGYPS